MVIFLPSNSVEALFLWYRSTMSHVDSVLHFQHPSETAELFIADDEVQSWIARLCTELKATAS